MKITQEAWQRLTESIDNKAAAIFGKSQRYHNFNVEVSVKDGTISTVIEMIGELENELRVLKRRLIEALPAEEQSKFPPV
jgi:hypothetical protein